MKKYLKNRFALTDKGAEGAIVAIKYSTLKSLSYMLPIMLLMYVLQGLLGLGDMKLAISILAFFIIGLVMLFIINKDYITTYNETYKESANLRIELIEIIKELPLSFYSRRDITDLSQTIMKDVDTIEHGLSHSLPSFYGFLINFALISILLLLGNFKLGLAIIIPIGLSIILNLFSRKMQIKATGTYYQEQRKSSKIFQELIDLSTEIKSYKLSDEKEKQARNFVKDLEKKHIKTELGQIIPIVSATIIANLSIALVIFVGLGQLMAGEINILYFAGYLFAGARLIDGVAAFNQAYGELMYMDSPIEKIKALRNEKIKKGNRADIKSYDIEGKDVEFSYLDDKKVIDKISFKALQDKTSALVGPSGCGKSTLIKLIARLYDYDKGIISIGDKDIKTTDTADLFKHISMVFQDVILFNGSVMDNIRIGKADASDEEVLKAAKLANCDEFVNKLKDGYQTEIGENGSKLSGGERQRISIARAFLKNAEIILLDEIAASLDVENEKYIQESLNKLTKNKTVIIISHRMKSIENVDQIIVMNDGKIEAFGKHDDLLKNSKTYKKMIESSKKSEEFIY
ncbi:ABC transporter ATP-binding protein/permease [Anaerococcus sp. NML200537]|uniref:ABC transporter ATP-binding protein n=1 Tax=Anaerococcus sp. NML200537 TaxID=2954485 RepID=UPI00223713DF|nr:ABC transporter ATP-binding protein [Anaerococcus sp. NML200537]MCW6701330.1 ABC transporter ATP-binding protein/permease [Anaerococcus sp. NML200537]